MMVICLSFWFYTNCAIYLKQYGWDALERKFDITALHKVGLFLNPKFKSLWVIALHEQQEVKNYSTSFLALIITEKILNLARHKPASPISTQSWKGQQNCRNWWALCRVARSARLFFTEKWSWRMWIIFIWW